jgi:lipoate---protein ligase
VTGEITPHEWALARELVESKFGTPEWTARVP